MNTKNDRVMDTMVSSVDRAPETVRPKNACCASMRPDSASQVPKAPVSRTITCSTRRAMKGTTQSDVFT